MQVYRITDQYYDEPPGDRNGGTAGMTTLPKRELSRIWKWAG